MAPTTIRWFQAAILLAAPAVMLAAFLYHPHIGNPVDPDTAQRIAEAVAAHPTQWAVAHLLTAVGSGLLVLAFLALHHHLREAGAARWSGPALPFVVMGSLLYALLPAMEFAPLAASRAGVDAHAVQEALYTWFVPTMAVAAVLFLAGAAGLALGIVRSGLLSPALARVVAGALVAMALARFVPLSLVQFHVQGLLGLVALWPLAHRVWTSDAPSGRGESEAPEDRTRGAVAGRKSSPLA